MNNCFGTEQKICISFQSFGTSHSVIGMAFSFMRFTADGGGFITGVLINRFGIRFVMFFGGLIHAIGLLASTLVDNTIWFSISIGLLFGIGNNMVYVTNTLIIPQYFDKVMI